MWSRTGRNDIQVGFYQNPGPASQRGRCRDLGWPRKLLEGADRRNRNSRNAQVSWIHNNLETIADWRISIHARNDQLMNNQSDSEILELEKELSKESYVRSVVQLRQLNISDAEWNDLNARIDAELAKRI